MGNYELVISTFSMCVRNTVKHNARTYYAGTDMEKDNFFLHEQGLIKTILPKIGAFTTKVKSQQSSIKCIRHQL